MADLLCSNPLFEDNVITFQNPNQIFAFFAEKQQVQQFSTPEIDSFTASEIFVEADRVHFVKQSILNC